MFCKTPCFGVAITNKMPRQINKILLDKIEDIAKKKGFQISNMVFNVGPTTFLYLLFFNVFSIKLVAILVILYQFVYQNNNNHFSFLVILYIYFSSTQIDAIIFLNHFGLLVSYLVLL